jgi:serine/threonine protein phosphatase PrpC
LRSRFRNRNGCSALPLTASAPIPQFPQSTSFLVAAVLLDNLHGIVSFAVNYNPAMTLRPGLEFAAKTDIGQVRSQNEDAIALGQASGFAILADGMGGYNGGEVASGIATAVLNESLGQGLARLQDQPQLRSRRARQIRELMDGAIRRANAAILEAGQAEPQYRGMGTTVVAAAFRGDKLTVAHVGDSRAYRLRNGQLAQITRDHSLLQEQIDAGLITPEAARFSLNRNLVTRAVGIGPEVDVEIHEHEAQAGDIYLLCSDGLTDMVDDEHIHAILTRTESTLENACEALVQSANDNGGDDNISVVLVRVGGGEARAQAEGLLGRIRSWVT